MSSSQFSSFPIGISNFEFNKTYRLRDIVCRTISNANKSCNSTSAKISESLIRVASTRIFSNPYQAIAEPIANSIDAYRRQLGSVSNIGRFGLGFFSLIYWIQTSQQDLEVLTRTTEEFWYARIMMIDDEATITFFDPISAEPLKGETGTRVTLNGLSTQDMREFEEQVRRFDFVNDVKIRINSTKPSSRPIIDVSFKQGYNYTLSISVEDSAGGISSETLLNSLLVPTSSTKGIMPRGEPRGTANIFQDRNKEKGLLFLVNNVVVTKITLPSSYLTYAIFLENVNVPVSRDDIILDSATEDVLVATFSQLLRRCIEMGYPLEDLFQHFEAYQRYTDQTRVAIIIQFVRNYMLTNKNIILLPSLPLAKLLQSQGYRNVNYLTDVNLVDSRRKLDALFPDQNGRDILRGIRIITLPGRFSLTDAGIPGYLFTSQPMPPVDNIISSYTGALLHKVGDPLAARDLTKLFTPGIPPKGGVLIELPVEESIGRSFVIVRGKYYDYAAALFLKDFKAGTVYTTPYPLTQIDLFRVKPLMVGSLSEDFLFLYNTIEAWVLGLGSRIDLATSHPGILTSNSLDSRLFDQLYKYIPDLPEKINAINIIFIHCVVAIYSFCFALPNTEANKDDISATAEYIAALTQMFNQMKISTNQGVDREVWFGRLAPDSWTPPNTPKIRRGLTGKTSSISVYRDGFFQSLKRILDTNYYLRDDVFLLDGRHFIGVALGNFVNKIEAKFRIKVNLPEPEFRTGFEGVIVYNSLNMALDMIPYASFGRHLISGFAQETILDDLRRRFPPSFFSRYLEEAPSPQNMSWIINTVYTPLVKTLEVQINLSNRSGVLPCNLSSSEVKKSMGSISLKKLIDYIYNVEVTLDDLDDLQHLIERVHDWVRPVPSKSATTIQPVEIAIEAGTTKPFVASVLTELIQNSLDAVNTALAAGRPVREDIEVTFCTSPAGADVMSSSSSSTPPLSLDIFQLGVRDYIGIPLRNLLSLLVPFLSGKTAEDFIATGEMGTGFFNVYRKPWCEYVNIETGSLFIKATPIDKDVIYEFFLQSPIEGSRINIISTPQSASKIADVTINVYIYAEDFMGVLSRPIYFNGEKQQRKPEFIYGDKVGKVRLIRSGGSHQSMILTNGVPFGTLLSTLDDMFGPISNYLLSTNLIVDLNKGSYIPVQGRNRLRSAKGNVLRNFFSTALTMATFAKLRDVDNATLERYMPGILSKDPIDQYNVHGAGFYTFNAKNGRWINQPLFYGLKHGEIYAILIHEYLRNYEKPSSDRNRQILEDYLSYNVQALENLKQMYFDSPFEDIINRWFDNKESARNTNITASAVQPLYFAGASSSNTAKATSEELLLGIFQTFTDVYYELGYRLNIPEFNFTAAPEVRLGDAGGGALAVYTNPGHRIVVDEKFLYAHAKPGLMVREWLEYRRLQKEDRVTEARYYLSMSKINDYLGNTRNAATLPHEIIHAITNSTHGRSSHNPINFTFEDKVHRDVPYDEVSWFIYSKLLELGLAKRV